jgi:hypothetical protein
MNGYDGPYKTQTFSRSAQNSAEFSSHVISHRPMPVGISGNSLPFGATLLLPHGSLSVCLLRVEPMVAP